MGRVYFGTDGIRGRVGHDPMTVDFALRLASSAARVLMPQGGTVLIGKDGKVDVAPANDLEQFRRVRPIVSGR